MHELPVIHKILALAVSHAQQAKATRIITISIEVGELSDLQPEWVQKYFAYVSKGTMAERAALLIERVPVKMLCGECGNTFLPDLAKSERITCPKCGSINYQLRSGRGYMVKSIEVV
jgi:hydrogenase nickel incorporation protein HypA/HybF